ncbi:hypothetical protein Tco_1497787 [Tanacetum coccineum]
MGDANPIRTLRDYSKSSHKGYKNTIELPVGNNVVPLRSDTIRLVQNECSFHELRSEDPNQHLNDFLKLMDSLDLDGENKERTRLQGLQNSACEIDRAADDKLRDKNADESLEIIENLALYDQEGWNDSKEFIKPVKAISAPISTSKKPDRRLLDLEDQINFLLKGARPTLRPSSTHIPQAYAEVEINDRMAEIFRLLKELTTSRAPEKVLIREEARSPVTKNVNSISLAKKEEERNDNDDMAADGGINGTHTKMPIKEAEKETKAKNGTKNKPIKKAKREETAEASSSLPVGYYLKHRINEKLIEGLVDNHKFNDSLSGIRVGKVKGKNL